MIITYPISNGRWVNTAGVVAKHEHYGSIYEGPYVVHVKNEELLEAFAGWDDLSQTLIKVWSTSFTYTPKLLLNVSGKLMNNPTRWVTNTVDDLPTFVSGRAAVIGDAVSTVAIIQCVS